MKGVIAFPIILLSLRKTKKEGKVHQLSFLYHYQKCRCRLYSASFRAVCIADSIIFPEAACCLGIGAAIRIPEPRCRFLFASAWNQKSYKQRTLEPLTTKILISAEASKHKEILHNIKSLNNSMCGLPIGLCNVIEFCTLEESKHSKWCLLILDL